MNTIKQDAGLERMAARFFPESDYLRREWLRAVAVVRSTQKGWVCDRKVPRGSGNA